MTKYTIKILYTRELLHTNSKVRLRRNESEDDGEREGERKREDKKVSVQQIACQNQNQQNCGLGFHNFHPNTSRIIMYQPAAGNVQMRSEY